MYFQSIVNFQRVSVLLEIEQGGLEQATWRILRLRIEGPCTVGYC